MCYVGYYNDVMSTITFVIVIYHSFQAERSNQSPIEEKPEKATTYQRQLSDMRPPMVRDDASIDNEPSRVNKPSFNSGSHTYKNNDIPPHTKKPPRAENRSPPSMLSTHKKPAENQSLVNSNSSTNQTAAMVQPTGISTFEKSSSFSGTKDRYYIFYILYYMVLCGITYFL